MIPVDDKPYVTIIVDRGVQLYSGVVQGELPRIVTALGAFSAAVSGLAAR